MSNEFAFDPNESVKRPLSMKGPLRAVRRLSGRAKTVLIAVMVVLLVIIAYAILSIDNTASSTGNKAGSGNNGVPSSVSPAPPPDLSQAPNGIQGASPPGPLTIGKLPPDTVSAKTAPPAPITDNAYSKPAASSAPVNGSGGQTTTVPELENDPGNAAVAQQQAALAAQKEAARKAHPVEVDWGSGTQKEAPATRTAPVPSATGNPDGHTQSSHGGNESDDPNKQGRKEKFLKAAANAPEQGYLQNVRRPPMAQYILKSNSLIPIILTGRVNSDLPGVVRAIVRSNVWDSRTGKKILIPQGADLEGTYDSQIAMGQQRILLVWNKVNFPDGSSLLLQGMPGSDGDGTAGLTAEVDNHWLKLFGSAAAMSIISGAAQLSQPATTTQGGQATVTASQTMAASLGQQLGQAGSAVIARNLNVQPTLKAKIGERVSVIITRTIVFPEPWKTGQHSEVNM